MSISVLPSTIPIVNTNTGRLNKSYYHSVTDFYIQVHHIPGDVIGI